MISLAFGFVAGLVTGWLFVPVPQFMLALKKKYLG